MAEYSLLFSFTLHQPGSNLNLTHLLLFQRLLPFVARNPEDNNWNRIGFILFGSSRAVKGLLWNPRDQLAGREQAAASWSHKTFICILLFVRVDQIKRWWRSFFLWLHSLLWLHLLPLTWRYVFLHLLLYSQWADCLLQSLLSQMSEAELNTLCDQINDPSHQLLSPLRYAFICTCK